MTTIDYHKEFILQTIKRMNENVPRIEKCIDLMMNDQIWVKENPKSNSVGNLVIHICGNMRQYIMSMIDGQKDSRKRDKEFSASGGKSAMELKELVRTTVIEAIDIISKCTPEDMLVENKVQIYTMTKMGAIIHVTEHFSYHTGQIASITKSLLNKDLGFYDDEAL